MIFNRFIKLFFLVLFSSSCKEKPEINKSVLSWEMLDFEVLGQSKMEKIAIFNHEDTCIYTLTIRDKKHFLKYGVYDQKNFSFILSKDEKSKLYKHFKDLFINLTQPKYEVSCYSGEDIKFTINQYGNPSLTCRYSSIANWIEISNSTKEIYDLTLKKIYSNKILSVKCKHVNEN